MNNITHSVKLGNSPLIAGGKEPASFKTIEHGSPVKVDFQRGGILKVMLLWRVFWLVRFVNITYREKNEAVKRDYFLVYYTVHKKKLFFFPYSIYDFNKLCNYAIKKGYLGEGLSSLYVRDEKGNQLMDFPLGTIECIGKEYGIALTVIGSLAVAVAGQWHNITRLFH